MSCGLSTFLANIKTEIVPRLGAPDWGPDDVTLFKMAIDGLALVRSSCAAFTKAHGANAGLPPGLEAGLAGLEEALRKRAADPVPGPGRPWAGVEVRLVSRAVPRPS